jgi:DNA primase
MPIRWAELDDDGLRPDAWSTATALDRVSSVGDAWSDLARHARLLPGLPSTASPDR